MQVRRLLGISGLLGAALGGYRLLTRGALTLDLGIGRRIRPLGPIERTIQAPREVVFDVIAAPYLGRTPRAMKDKLRVWERGADMVLAEHLTRSNSTTTATLETVCVDTVEAGYMTKDLALLVGADQRWLSTTGFLDKVAENLTKAMAA